MSKVDDYSARVESIADNLREDADAANSWEHSLTTRQALKVYKKAVFWSIVMSLTIIMEGFDTKILGSLYAQPAFQEAYGIRLANGSFQIPAPWQSGLGGISGVTSILGMFLGGWLTERFGFRLTMMWSLIAMPAPIFALFFAPSLEIIAVGQFLLGIPLGVFQTVTTVYAAEVMPTRLRPYLTSFISLVWAIGQLLCAVVLRGTLNLPSPWAYRVPFALQWFWPVILIGGVYLAPESPWWLVRQHRLADAEIVVSQLTSDDLEFDVKKIVALMVFTTEHERSIESSTSYLACFRGVNLRRTIIVIGVYCMQTITGAPLRSYMTYFFQNAGLPTSQAFNMTIVGLSLAVLGVLGSWIVMTYFGRRTMYLWGCAISTVLFIAIGGLGVPLRNGPSSALSWAIGGLLMFDAFIADLLILPVTFTLVSEIPSSLLRSKSVVVARNSYTAVNIIIGVVTPYMLNPSAWNWGALTGFFWGGACILGFLFTYFMVPESKGRTTAEMDFLFERKISVQKFKTAEVTFTEIEDIGVSHA